MSAATVPVTLEPPAALRPAARRWLYGAATDLLLGCGVAYALFFLLLVLAGSAVQSAVPIGLMPLVALAAGAPHYGATLLRVYERREDRRAYRFFTLYMTLLVWALFVACLSSAWLGSLVLTIYLTWSPWHYTGQNYGIALMLMHRRGVPVPPRAKRLLHLSFVLSFLLTAVAIHGGQSGATYTPLSYDGTEYRLLSLGIPPAVDDLAFRALGVAYLATLGGALWLLGRGARARDLLPSACVIATQSLWFAVPALARHADALQTVFPLSAQHALYTFLWIAAAHSVQYLWVSSYFAKVGGRAPSQVGYYAKALCAGAAIWVVPALLFAPGVLGRVPYDAGLGVMVAAAVNLHHFLLDGAIWKLRDGRIARVLVRGKSNAADDAYAAGARPQGRRLWPVVAALGALSVGVIAYGTTAQEIELRRALDRGDLPRAEAAIGRLRWIGRDGPSLRTAYGVAAADAGQLGTAQGALERALALRPTPETWRSLGAVRQRAGDDDGAIRAYLEALTLRPGWADATNDLAWLRATSSDAALRDAADAVRLAEEAARTTGLRSAPILDTLAAAYASSLRYPEAVSAGERASALARAAAQESLAREIDARVAGYRAGTPYRAPAVSPPGVVPNTASP